jgi:predicted ABC-type ATPase
MNLTELKPQFILVMGGAGSGKNYFISHSPYAAFTLIDVDAIKGSIGLTAAMQQLKPMMISAFENKENVAHPTTGSNLKGQQNKIALARQYGYAVTLILIDTDPTQAIAQVRKRVRAGGHDVELDAIINSNKRARENYETLKALANNANVVH